MPVGQTSSRQHPAQTGVFLQCSTPSLTMSAWYSPNIAASWGRLSVKSGAVLRVRAALRRQAEAVEQPPRVGVHHEHRLPQGVEQDIVRGLLPDAVNAQQLLPEGRRVAAAHRVQVVPEGFSPRYSTNALSLRALAL